MAPGEDADRFVDPAAPVDEPIESGPTTPWPASVRRSIQLTCGLIALGALTTVLAVVFEDDLIAAWAKNQPADTTIQQPAFAPVAIVLFIVTAGTIAVMLPFYRGGYNWGRITLVAIVSMIAITTLAGLRTEPPVLFVVISLLSIPLDAAIVWFMVHRDTNAFLRGDRHATG